MLSVLPSQANNLQISAGVTLIIKHHDDEEVEQCIRTVSKVALLLSIL